MLLIYISCNAYVLVLQLLIFLLDGVKYKILSQNTYVGLKTKQKTKDDAQQPKTWPSLDPFVIILLASLP